MLAKCDGDQMSHSPGHVYVACLCPPRPQKRKCYMYEAHRMSRGREGDLTVTNNPVRNVVCFLFLKLYKFKQMFLALFCFDSVNNLISPKFFSSDQFPYDS